MKKYDMPVSCPFCSKEHLVNLLNLEISSAVKCPHCKRQYLIPYSEIRKLNLFQDDLNALFDESAPNGNNDSEE